MGPDPKDDFFGAFPQKLFNVHDLFKYFWSMQVWGVLGFCFWTQRESEPTVLQKMYCKEDKLFCGVLLEFKLKTIPP